MTANWRGYHGTWKIKDGRLYLDKLQGHVEGREELLALDELLPNAQPPIFAEWFSGELHLGTGARVRTSRGTTYGVLYRDNVYLEIKNGVLRAMRTERDDRVIKGAPVFHLYNNLLPEVVAWKSGAQQNFDAHFSASPRPHVVELRLRQFAPEEPQRTLPNSAEPFDLTVAFSVQTTCDIKWVLAQCDAMAEGKPGGSHGWECDGAWGKLEWRRELSRYAESSDKFLVALAIEWHQEDGKEYRRTVRAPGLDVALTIYSALRRFVESPFYDPFRYECLKTDQAWRLLIADVKSDDIVTALAALSASDFQKFQQALQITSRERQQHGTWRRKGLQEYLEESKTLEVEPTTSLPMDVEPYSGWLNGRYSADAWNAFTPIERAHRLRFFAILENWPGCNGSRLTELVAPAMDAIVHTKAPHPIERVQY